MGENVNPTANKERAMFKAPRYKDERKKDPCYMEGQMSMKCLAENGYDKEKCAKHFVNFKNCKKFWRWVEADRRKKGIEPALPPPSEREAVKEEYRHYIGPTRS